MTKHLELNLQGSFEFTGLWWLPSAPDIEIGGTLTYSPSEGVHLDLLGAFRDLLDERSTIAVVNGVTSNGIVCTLFNNTEVNSNSGWPGFFRQRLRTALLAMGCELATMDELIFDKCRVSYEHLEEWVAGKLFDANYSFDEEQYGQVIVSAKPEEWYNDQISAIDGQFRIMSDLHSGQNPAGSFNLSSEIFIEIDPIVPKPFQQYRKWLVDVQRLLGLFLSVSTYPRKIHGHFDRSEPEFNHQLKVASIFFPMPGLRTPRTIHRSDMLLTLEHLTGHVSNVFQSWLTADHGVRQAIFLFFSLADNDDADVETKFVNQAHALESFQRSTGQG